jgi:tRNA threonylcarbamoyladenosine modification (KEOPS) complex  Pcc1 subunit
LTELKNAKAEAEVSIDLATEADAEAMVRALFPEIAAPRTARASVRVTRRGKVAKIAFYARDLVALRAIMNSFLRFAATWRRVSETLSLSQRRARRVRQTRRPEAG